MNDEHLLPGITSKTSYQHLNVLDYGTDFDSAAEDAVASASVILYNTNTLPLYPAPVGRRLDWTFAEASGGRQHTQQVSFGNNAGLTFPPTPLYIN